MSAWQPKCGCGKFVGQGDDDGTVYGCSSYDPPEPHDPEYFCKKCAAEAKKEAVERLTQYIAEGKEKISAIWWQMPRWYVEALRKTGWEKKSDHYLYRIEK